MKIAVLGGSFNPIHKGHLFLAEKVKNSLGYEKILFVPSYISPFKQKIQEISNKDRICLLKKALKNKNCFAIENYELKQKGLSYTYHTICYLNRKYQKALQKEKEKQFQKIGLILGLDLLEDFHKWHEYKKLAEQVYFIIAKRSIVENGNKNAELEKALKAFPFSYELLHNEYIDISSTDIRAKIKKKENWQPLVPERVAYYIQKKDLYGK